MCYNNVPITLPEDRVAIESWQNLPVSSGIFLNRLFYTVFQLFDIHIYNRVEVDSFNGPVAQLVEQITHNN